MRYDFGDVAQGQSLQCEFRFSNVGPQNIRVRSVDSTCGCIVDKSEKPWLAPGEADLIRVTLKTEGYEAPRRLRKRVAVQFEPGELAPVVLTVEAMITPDVIAEPAKLVCPQRTEADESVLKLTLRRRMLDREAFATVELAATEGYYDIETLSRSEDEIAFSVTLLYAKAPAHPRPLLVRYRAPSDTQREIRIPVEFEHPADQVVVAPSEYFQMIQGTMGSQDLPAATRQGFQLAARNQKHLTITRIEAQDDRNLAWQVHRHQDGARFSVWVKAVPTRRLYSTTLNVHYRGDANAHPGMVSLDATVFVQRTHAPK